MDSEEDDSDDGFKPAKKPVAETKPVIAQAVSQKQPVQAKPQPKGKNLFGDDDESDEEDLKFKANKSKKEEEQAARKPQVPASTMIPNAATAQAQKAAPTKKQKTVKFMDSEDEESEDDFKPAAKKPAPKPAPVTKPPEPQFSNPPKVKPVEERASENIRDTVPITKPPTAPPKPAQPEEEEGGERKLTIKELQARMNVAAALST